MSQLMQVNICVNQICLRCPLIIRLQDSVSEGDRTDIFHRTNAKLWNVNHVVLCKGEVIAKKCSVESNSLLNNFKDLSMVNLIEFALADKDSHLSRCIMCLVNDLCEFTGTETVDVRAYRRTLLEVPQDALII